MVIANGIHYDRTIGGGGMNIGSVIMNKRKSLGYTQQNLADKLHVSFQTVSKWENGTSCPGIELLPTIAAVLGTSVDTLLGYHSAVKSDYEERYKSDEYYWGLNPNRMCYEIMKLKPPIKPLKVLDIGCGEGKDAVFFAKNGYIVSALDIAESGLEKGKMLADRCGTYVNFFKADIMDYRLDNTYDIIFSSGIFHFVKPEIRNELFENLKSHTVENGIHAINVFVNKPYVKSKTEHRFAWKSGEMFMHYHDWHFHSMEEVLFDCNSGGMPHQHCMDTMIAEKVSV